VSGGLRAKRKEERTRKKEGSGEEGMREQDGAWLHLNYSYNPLSQLNRGPLCLAGTVPPVSLNKDYTNCLKTLGNDCRLSSFERLIDKRRLRRMK